MLEAIFTCLPMQSWVPAPLSLFVTLAFASPPQRAGWLHWASHSISLDTLSVPLVNVPTLSLALWGRHAPRARCLAALALGATLSLAVSSEPS